MKTKEKILQKLRTAPGTFFSGEDLRAELGISRTAVWKNIQTLREEGFSISSVTNRGYALLEEPDILTEESIRASLSTRQIGQALRVFSVTDSTNNEAKRQALQGVPHGTVFVAEEQTGGKGRLGRNWVSPPGLGLWFSLLLRPHCTPQQASRMTLLAGLAVCRALQKEIKVDARIKWPNDIVIGSRKVCGILTEMGAEMEQIEYVVIGIGINIHDGCYPPELKERAVSLDEATGKTWNRAAVLRAILTEFEEILQENERCGLQILLSEYRSQCVTLGRTVSCSRPDGEIRGQAMGITEEGELIIQTENGEKAVIYSGEVSVQGFYGQK